MNGFNTTTFLPAANTQCYFTGEFRSGAGASATVSVVGVALVVVAAIFSAHI
jgi:hypothetical protein